MSELKTTYSELIGIFVRNTRTRMFLSSFFTWLYIVYPCIGLAIKSGVSVFLFLLVFPRFSSYVSCTTTDEGTSASVQAWLRER